LVWAPKETAIYFDRYGLETQRLNTTLHFTLGGVTAPPAIA
jgi:hypothetical protein